MERNNFTEKDIIELQKNKYVKSITINYISFTKEFKEHFVEETKNGKTPKRIFAENQIDPSILGTERIRKFVKRIRKKLNNNEPLDDNRGKNSKGRRKINDEKLTPEEKIETLKHENAMLKAENDLLKKMKFLIEKQQLRKSNHNKDIK